MATVHSSKARVELHTIEACPKYSIDKRWTVQGRSRASDRSGFVLLEAGIFFDAGLSTYLKPNALCLTHSHTDHSFALPMISIQPSTFPVYLHKDATNCIRSFLLTTQSLSTCHLVDASTFTDESLPEVPQLRSVEPDSELFQLAPDSKQKSLYAKTINLVHRVPAVGYVIYERKSKLMEQYVGKTPKELGELRKAGVEISQFTYEPILAYLTDTHITGISHLFESTLPPLAPFVMVECTYLNGLGGEKEDWTVLAEKFGHIDWHSLRPVIEQRKDITFALIHFSMRYSDEEIIAYFSPIVPSQLPNVVIWLDSGVWPEKNKV